MGYKVVVRDEAGNEVGSLWTGILDRSYLLPDGRRCEMPQTVAWCRDCRAFVAAEEVPSVAEIGEFIAAVRSGSRGFEAWQTSRGEPPLSPYYLDEKWDWFARTQVDWMERVREWRLLRCDPPHCLSCFSTEVYLFPKYENGVIHPETGQRLHVGAIAHMSMAYHWEYSVEGLPLEARASASAEHPQGFRSWPRGAARRSEP